MEFLDFLKVPLIIFLSAVVPIWILFHYITKWKMMKKAGAGDGEGPVSKQDLLRLKETADYLEDRVASLETILDAQVPNWRQK